MQGIINIFKILNSKIICKITKQFTLGFYKTQNYVNCTYTDVVAQLQVPLFLSFKFLTFHPVFFFGKIPPLQYKKRKVLRRPQRILLGKIHQIRQVFRISFRICQIQTIVVLRGGGVAKVEKPYYSSMYQLRKWHLTSNNPWVKNHSITIS